MKQNETTEQTFHFDTTPRRASNPLVVVVVVVFVALVACASVIGAWVMVSL
jgi:hypothetical protein